MSKDMRYAKPNQDEMQQTIDALFDVSVLLRLSARIYNVSQVIFLNINS